MKKTIAFPLALAIFLTLPFAVLAKRFDVSNGDTRGLIDAIILSNGQPDLDTIVLFENGSYSLASLHNNTNGPNALPVVVSPIVVLGNGATLNRTGVGALRFFLVGPNGRLTLDRLSMNAGRLTSLLEPEGFGAAIFVQGELQASNCVFSNNTAGAGGGAVYGQPSSLINIQQCVFRDNRADGPRFNNSGGALYLNGARATVNGSSFNNNMALRQSAGGGAVFVRGNPQAAEPLFTNCVFLANSANFGGAAYLFFGARAVFDRCVFEENVFGDTGGTGIDAGGALFVDNSTATVRRSHFERNGALTGSPLHGRGGAVYYEREAGFAGAGKLQLDACLFWNNRARSGGALASENADGPAANEVLAENTTFFENTAVEGGAIAVKGGRTFETLHCTFAQNSATTVGGAFYLDPCCPSGFSLKNSILSQNTAPEGPNCTPGFSNGGGNLQFPGNGCGAGIPTADPLLGALADNGGPTRTLALLPGSPAIGAGTACAGSDQRGAERRQPCSSGAYEASGDVTVGLGQGEGQPLVLYPNPVPRGKAFFVQLPENLKGPFALQLYSADGRHVAQIPVPPVTNGLIEVPTRLTPGVYLLRLTAGNERFQGKIAVTE